MVMYIEFLAHIYDHPYGPIDVQGVVSLKTNMQVFVLQMLHWDLY